MSLSNEQIVDAMKTVKPGQFVVGSFVLSDCAGRGGRCWAMPALS